MRKHLATFGAAFLATSLGWCGLVMSLSGKQTPGTFWIDSIYKRKEGYAERIQKPKVVFIGGSATHFGIETETASKRLGIPAVNLGTHAGLGLEYLLHRARKSLRPGDLAVVVVEYGTLEKPEASDLTSEFVMCRDTDYLKSVPLKERVELLLSMSFRTLDSSLRAAPGQVDLPGCYGRDSTDAEGDETCAQAKFQDLPRLRSFTAKDVLRTPSPDSERLLGEFAKWCRDTHVTLVASFPPTIDLPELRSGSTTVRKVFDAQRSVYTRLGIDCVGSQVDFLYPTESFFDTNHHLLVSKQVEHTERMCQALLKDPTVQKFCSQRPVASGFRP